MEFWYDLPQCKSCFCFIPLRLGSIFIALLDTFAGATILICFSLYYIEEEIAENVNKAAKESNFIPAYICLWSFKRVFITVFGQLSSESMYVDICLSAALFVIGILLLVAALHESKNLINIYVFAKSLLCVATLMGTFFNFYSVPLKGFVFFGAFIFQTYFLLCVISYLHELPEIEREPPIPPKKKRERKHENIELKESNK